MNPRRKLVFRRFLEQKENTKMFLERESFLRGLEAIFPSFKDVGFEVVLTNIQFIVINRSLRRPTSEDTVWINLKGASDTRKFTWEFKILT